MPPNATFILTETEVTSTHLVPEIPLRLAHDPRGIFEAARTFQAHNPQAGDYPPYWAFAWPGGQAMARHILDAPALVRGQRIADIGAGSGIASIAAARSGAAHVLAVDVDPLAAEAISLNATLNDVAAIIEPSISDCLGDLLEVDLILISDLVYEPELAVRVGAFIERAIAAGLPVLIGDRLSARRPARGFTETARYSAPLTPPLNDEETEMGRVWLQETRARKTRGSRRANIAE